MSRRRTIRIDTTPHTSNPGSGIVKAYLTTPDRRSWLARFLDRLRGAA